MPKETETKFKVESEEIFKKNLRKIGARFVSKEFEQDTYYSGAAGHCSCNAIRLRSAGKKGVFTIKKPTRGKRSRTYKVREELEVGVTDVKAFTEILRQLGFRPLFRKEKIRETYKWKSAKLSIDTLPFIGIYAEIEAPKKRIKEAARLLGLDMERAMPSTYMQLFNHYRVLRKKPGLQFVFSGKK